MGYYLAIDAGTTKIKTAIFDETGKLIGIRDRVIQISMPQKGWCEMDMDELWGYVSLTLKDLKKGYPQQWEAIDSIGVAAQGEGAWLLDENKQPVRNAILWNDTRNDQIPESVWEDAKKICMDNHATPLCVGSPIAILHWLKNNEPDNYSRVEHILFCKDWIKFKLTGQMSTDYTDISTTAFDIINLKPVPELFDLLVIEEMNNKIPKIYDSGDVIGRVHIQGSIETGIKEGTPVIAGSIDVAAAAAGLGAVEPGDSGSIIGTALGNIAILGKEAAESFKTEEGSVLCHVKQGSYLRQVSALSGAVVLDWCKKELGACDDIKKLEEEAKSVEAGAGGAIFLPYLFGERAPFKAPNATASFSGLRFNHTRSHMVRAVYESLAYSLYDCRLHMPKAKEGIHVAGGGSKSDFICQIISDITGEKVHRSANSELGLYGIYRLMSKDWSIKNEAEDIFLPNEENTLIYREMYKEYCRIRECFL